MPIEMRVRYDKVADALYIRFRDERVVESEEVEPGVIVDYNDRGEIVGVEVLWFSQHKIDLNNRELRLGPSLEACYTLRPPKDISMNDYLDTLIKTLIKWF